MKGWNRLGVVFVGIILALSITSAHQQKKMDDEAAVRDAVKQYVEARERGDEPILQRPHEGAHVAAARR